MIWSLLDILVRFVVQCNGKSQDIKDNYFLKMSVYLSNIFNESEDNYITTVLTCLDTNPLFSIDFQK